MASKHFYSPRADTDLNDIARFILQDNLEAAVRFVDAVEATCIRLTEMPDMGRVFQYTHKPLAGIRMMRVGEPYSAYLVFYRKAGSRIEVVRILHGSRNYPVLFEE